MKRTFTHIADAYRARQDGNVAIMFAVTVFALIAGLAIAVDVTNAHFAKQRLQDTTDAIALMAAKDKTLDTEAKLTETAQVLYNATYAGETGQRIVIQSIRRDGDTVTVEARNNIDTYFTGIFYTTDMDVAVTSTAVFARRSLDIALVLDTTGSMESSVGGGRGTSKLAGLQEAANSLIDTLEDTGNDNVRVSVVPFSQYTNIGVSSARASWLDLDNDLESSWNGCVGSRENRWDEQATSAGGQIPGLISIASTKSNGRSVGDVSVGCGSELLPLTDNMTEARASIRAFEAKGWTYIPSGIVWGWRTLLGDLPTRVAEPPKDTEHKRVMVIMTDGENTRSKRGLGHEGWDGNAADAKTSQLCTNVKRDDIEVYTIAYALDHSATKSLMRNCASDADKFFDAQTSTALSQAFKTIGNSLDRLRITS